MRLEKLFQGDIFFSPNDDVGKPRPPSPQEIAQAIYNHAVGDGPTPLDFSAGFTEVFVAGANKSVINYHGGLGDGNFELPWPTTPLPEVKPDGGN